jgi:hypothetical protein
MNYLNLNPAVQQSSPTETNFVILSFPQHKKHYVLRTVDSDMDLTLKFDHAILKATILAIADSYKEAEIVQKNLLD